MIDGVEVRKLKQIRDKRGFLMEIFRESWFKSVKQVYVTTLLKGMVKDWKTFHLHNRQQDHMCCLTGRVRLVMVDVRTGSATQNNTMTVEMGEDDYKIVKIPQKVLHALQNIGKREAYVINCIDREYDPCIPDELRVPNTYWDWENNRAIK